jgi:hypothetical protein
MLTKTIARCKIARANCQANTQQQKTAFGLLALALIGGMTLPISGWTAPCDVITNGLIACYPFDGDANDASSNGNHGTVYGATLTTDRFNQPSSAYSFNGNGDSVLVSSNSSLNLTTLTISVWIKIPSDATFTTDYDIVSKDGESFDRQYLLTVNSAGKIVAHIGKDDGNFR